MREEIISLRGQFYKISQYIHCPILDGLGAWLPISFQVFDIFTLSKEEVEPIVSYPIPLSSIIGCCQIHRVLGLPTAWVCGSQDAPRHGPP